MRISQADASSRELYWSSWVRNFRRRLMEPTSVLVSMIESGHEFGDLAQRLRVGVTQKGVATRTAQFLCLITLCETETALYHSDGRRP